MRRRSGAGRSTRTGAVVLAAAMLASSLAGCGRAGSPEPPPDPRVAAQADGGALDALPRRPRRAPIAKPNDAFILDPLL